jgi:hypothetical protein
VIVHALATGFPGSVGDCRPSGRPGRYVPIPAARLLGRGDAFEVVRDTV